MRLANGGGTIRIYDNIPDVLNLFSADGTLQLVNPPNPGANTETIHIQDMMWVPNAFIHHLLGQRLTPREFVEVVLDDIHQQGLAANMQPLVRWGIAAATATTAGGNHSHLL